jgi:ribosomal protein S18
MLREIDDKTTAALKNGTTSRSKIEMREIEDNTVLNQIKLQLPR